MRKPQSHKLSINHCRHLAFVLLLGLFLTSLLQATPLELTALQQIYDQQIAGRVTGPYEAGLTQLNTNYSGGLDRAINEAKKTGKLDLIIALEEEKKRLVDKIPLPESDEETPAELKSSGPSTAKVWRSWRNSAPKTTPPSSPPTPKSSRNWKSPSPKVTGWKMPKR
jgi:hypothetical protein